MPNRFKKLDINDRLDECLIYFFIIIFFNNIFIYLLI